MRTLAILMAGLLSLGLAGCEDLRTFLAQQQPKTVPQQPAQVNPDIRWVSEPTEILGLQGPETAKAGSPVEVTAVVVIGSSSCNRVGEVTLDVDEAARTVTVRATRLKAEAEGELPCTDDYGWTSKKARFTPQSPGTYQVVAQGYKPGYGAPGNPEPRGAFTLVVTE